MYLKSSWWWSFDVTVMLSLAGLLKFKTYFKTAKFLTSVIEQRLLFFSLFQINKTRNNYYNACSGQSITETWYSPRAKSCWNFSESTIVFEQCFYCNHHATLIIILLRISLVYASKSEDNLCSFCAVMIAGASTLRTFRCKSDIGITKKKCFKKSSGIFRENIRNRVQFL